MTTVFPELDDATVFRAQRAATACILNTTRLLMLTRENVEWPYRETTWERADDAFIASTLGIDPDDVDSICGFGDRPVPAALKEMPDLLRYFSRNDAEPSPDSIAYDIGTLIQHLVTRKLLAKSLNDDGVLRLKSALILRASLHYIEDSLRTLHVGVPLLARAKLSHAMTVQQEMSGSTPFSPTPFGPLQLTVSDETGEPAAALVDKLGGELRELARDGGVPGLKVLVPVSEVTTSPTRMQHRPSRPATGQTELPF